VCVCVCVYTHTSGCNLGLFSLAALRNGCDVVCVEPNAKLVTIYSYIYTYTP